MMPLEIPERFAKNPFPDCLSDEDKALLGSIDDLWSAEDDKKGLPGMMLSLGEESKTLGMLMHETEFADVDQARKAMSWAHEAAIRGIGSAAQSLAQIYHYGEAGVVDEEAAAFWYARAIEWIPTDPDAHALLGLPEDAPNQPTMAMLHLARLLESPRQIAPDPDRALDLYRDAATAGDPIAQWNVFRMLSEGQGVDDEQTDDSDLFEAMCSLDRAARGGVEDAIDLFDDYREALDTSYAHSQFWIWWHLREGSRLARVRVLRMLIHPDSEVHDPAAAAAYISELSNSEHVADVLSVSPEMMRSGDEHLVSAGRQMLEYAAETLGQPWANLYVRALLDGEGGDDDIGLALSILSDEVDRTDVSDEYRAQQYLMLAEIYDGTHGGRWRDEGQATLFKTRARNLSGDSKQQP